jgi:hypothetical protein
MRLLVPAQAPLWLTAFARSVEDLFRSILPSPLRLMGLASADLPTAGEYSQGLVFDLTNAEILYSTGSAWQRLFGSGNPALGAMAALAPAADRYPYFTGPNSAGLGTISAAGRALLDDLDAAAQRATLGLGSAATEAVGTTGSKIAKLDGANVWSGSQTFDAPFSASSGGLVYASFFSATVAAFGSGTGTAAPGSFQFRGANATGTNIAGGTLTFAAGRGTGSGAAAILVFQTPTPLGPGSSQQANVTRLTINNVGIDVTGEARCDTLRIDATPTAGAVANTHTVPVNINGTVYQMLLRA